MTRRAPFADVYLMPTFSPSSSEPEVEFSGGVAVTIQLTEEQKRAVDSAGATPTQVVDPRTSATYVLIPMDDYDTVRKILRDERQQKAIRAVALRNAAGRIEP
jgi:hypothetical protein